MKDCVLLGAWIPNSNRIIKYIEVLQIYYADCDIYVGINPSSFQQEFITALVNSGLNVLYEIVGTHLVIPQHASANQVALRLYKESKIQYSVVHFLHTKGISYDDLHHQRAFDDYYLAHAKARTKISDILECNKHIGSYNLYGMIQPQWYCKVGYDSMDIPRPTIGTNFSMAQSVADSNDENEVHPYFDLAPYYDFKYSPLRTQSLIAIYAIKDHIVREFVDNCSPEVFERNVYDLGYDMYFFETHFPQIVSRMGYLPYIETIWNLGNYGTKDTEIHMINLWKEENNLNLIP